MAKIMREKEVVAELRIPRTTLRRMVERGEFPARVSLTARTFGYRRAEVMEWLATRERVTLRA